MTSSIVMFWVISLYMFPLLLYYNIIFLVHWCYSISLVAGGPSGEHIRLQAGEEALLIATLSDLHVQEVWVHSRVVDLREPHLNGLL